MYNIYTCLNRTVLVIILILYVFFNAAVVEAPQSSVAMAMADSGGPQVPPTIEEIL